MENNAIQNLPANADMSMGVFASSTSFELAQRMAKALAASTIVPKEYQGNVSNALIAVEMAARLHTSPMMVMQNLYVVNGRPAWSSQYIIAMINGSGKYRSELQFEMEGSGDSLSCYAWAEDRSGHRVTGPKITMAMAKAEGWVNRTGSKWQTMPEVMIRYRAASFFGRMYCPDMIMGIYSREEVIEGDYVIEPNAEDIRITEEPVPEPEPQSAGHAEADASDEEPDF